MSNDQLNSITPDQEMQELPLEIQRATIVESSCAYIDYVFQRIEQIRAQNDKLLAEREKQKRMAEPDIYSGIGKHAQRIIEARNLIDEALEMTIPDQYGDPGEYVVQPTKAEAVLEARRHIDEVTRGNQEITPSWYEPENQSLDSISATYPASSVVPANFGIPHTTIEFPLPSSQSAQEELPYAA